MDEQELLSLNAEGIIPGPGETEEAFRLRAAAIKDFFHRQDEFIPLHHWQWAFEQLQFLFDFTPRWCPAFYSSKDLAPWQAAATWIQDLSHPAEEPGYVKPVYIIQIKKSRWVSWLVDRDELLAHEAAHAARAAFNEPKTEELFAYLTSPVKWRQVVGPVFSHPRESLLLISILGLGTILQMIETMADICLFSGICFFAAAGMISAWALRLLRMRARITKAARQLAPMLRDPEKVRAVLFRLTDEEIIQLSRKEKVQGEDLRWQLIKAVYLK